MIVHIWSFISNSKNYTRKKEKEKYVCLTRSNKVFTETCGDYCSFWLIYIPPLPQTLTINNRNLQTQTQQNMNKPDSPLYVLYYLHYGVIKLLVIDQKHTLYLVFVLLYASKYVAFSTLAFIQHPHLFSPWMEYSILSLRCSSAHSEYTQSWAALHFLLPRCLYCGRACMSVFIFRIYTSFSSCGSWGSWTKEESIVPLN